MIKKVVIASDHRGFSLKQYLMQEPSIDWLDVGAFTDERSDYPLCAHKALDALREGYAENAVLICGTGNGMAIVANRSKGIYACVVWDVSVALRAKEEDNCNVLVIPADYVRKQQARNCITSWLKATFKGGRYAQRLEDID